MSKNVLIIGASGRLGRAIIQEFSASATPPAIHAFVRTPSKLSETSVSLCTSIQTGDALSADDVTHALQRTTADYVIVSIGIPDSTAPTSLRADSAHALLRALNSGGFAHVRVACVSAIGAGGSVINAGFGVGVFVKWRLRFLLRDHDRQEEILRRGLGEGRVLVVRPTGLVDGKVGGKNGGKIVVFGDQEKCPSVSIGREEVAEFLVRQICGDGELFGKCVNIASVGAENGMWGIKALLTLV